MASTSLEASLKDFVHAIDTPSPWKDLARKTVHKVFEILKRKSIQFDLDRCRIVGGFEKGTSTKLKADADTGKNRVFEKKFIKKSLDKAL